MRGWQACRWLGWGLLSVALAIAARPAGAQTAAAVRRSYTTQRIEGSLPVLDGRPVEAAWDRVVWAGDFTQRTPCENQPPSEATEFKILYDDEALYVAFRAWDREPDRIRRELARRDWFPGDWVEINIDSRGDGRTAFSFTTSVSGVRSDEYISEDGRHWDTSWDPVWWASTAQDEKGWTAEIRIPFNQLRYSERPEQVWGIQVTRRIHRHEERSVWQFIPADCPGWVSAFGELRGIRGIRAQKQIELMPYGVAYGERSEEIAGNPFATGRDARLDGGLDGKVGLSGNLILDLTVNPDFGQVEADPAQVNLTAFETIFEERRPFFIEGSEVLRYPLARAITGGSFAGDRLFYSRRIGRVPQRDLDDELEWRPGLYIDAPTATSILGAAKVSGKTAGGFSLGLLEAVTGRERAAVADSTGRRRLTVEPPTNYLVARAQQEMSAGRTLLGGMVTAVHRDVSDPGIDFLPTAAYAAGLDFEHRWSERTWQFLARALVSHARGSRRAMSALQTSPARYYQRPDAESVRLDTTRTSLSGAGGSAYLGKTNGRWRFQTGAALRSPGFELNDVGYLRQAGEINQSSWVGYYVTQPFSIFNELEVNGNQWLYWDWDGRSTVRQFNMNTELSFKNQWELHADVTRLLEMRSTTLLRGGPSILCPGSLDFGLRLNTDARRLVMLGMGLFASEGDRGTGNYREAFVEVTCRPVRALRVRVAPDYTRSRSALQYVAQRAFGEEPRYLLASIEQRTASLVVRLDYCITPNLTLQYYAQPFVSSARYSDFKRVTEPSAAEYCRRFDVLEPGTELLRATGVYGVDEDRDGQVDYGFRDPDFNYRTFNSNLVLRWEYRPGSTLFLVWSQRREGLARVGRFELGDDLEALFDLYPDDILLIKVSRRFSL